MKNILFILLVISVNSAFTQDYFGKKYPNDNERYMDYDIDSNIVIFDGKLLSLDRLGNVNWIQETSTGKIGTTVYFSDQNFHFKQRRKACKRHVYLYCKTTQSRICTKVGG